ncbi:hypothetical protein [Melittangium boletus]|uniref:hypothetical protein n=1 Tax=Melittangium boletus TaxID=83453 RepID=UPI003DA3E527
MSSRPSRKRRWALAAGLLLLLLLWWWPSPPEPVAVVAPPEPPPAPGVVARPAPAKKKPVARKPAPPPVPVLSSQRALLRRAMEARAPDLRACPLPPGVPPTVGARIQVAQTGATRAAVLSSAQRLPRELSDCVRQRLLAWEFSDVGLTSDVEVFVDFALGR